MAAQGFLETIGLAVRADLGIKIGVAVLAGGAIGLERQVAGKPAGLRTNILICVGSALLMDLSVHVGSVWGGTLVGDPGRMAAQVITGVGFLCAGTIMQSGGNISGLTSAATIWVVAAIGLAAGGGFIFEALAATLTVMVVLAGMGRFEHRLLRAARTMSVTIRAAPGTPEEWLRSELGIHGIRVLECRTFDHARDRVFELRLRGPSRQFDVLKEELAESAEVRNIFID